MTEPLSLGVINTDMGAESVLRRRRRGLVAHLTNLLVLYDTVYIRTEDYLELPFLTDVFTQPVLERLLETRRLRFVFSPQFGLSRRGPQYYEGWDQRQDDYILENWIAVSWSAPLHNPWAAQRPEHWPPLRMEMSSHPAPVRLIEIARKGELKGLDLQEDALPLAGRMCIVSQPLFRRSGPKAIDAYNAELSIRGILNTRFGMLLDLALAKKYNAQVACHYRQYALKPPHRFADLDHAPLSRLEHGLAGISYLLGLPSTYTAIWANHTDPAHIAQATFHRDAAHFRRWVAERDTERVDQSYAREVSRLLFRDTTSLDQWVGWGISSLIGAIPIVGGVAGAAAGALATATSQQKSAANIFVEGNLRTTLRTAKEGSHREALAKLARKGISVPRRKPGTRLWTETKLDAPEDLPHLRDEQLARLYLFPYPPERDIPPLADRVDSASPLAKRLHEVAEDLRADARNRVESGALASEEIDLLRHLLNGPVPVTRIPNLVAERGIIRDLERVFPGLRPIIRYVYKDLDLCVEIQRLFKPDIERLLRDS